MDLITRVDATASTELPILVDRSQEGLAVVTFNRPRHLNAWTQDLMVRLFSSLEEVLSSKASPPARVVLFHGVGRAFGAGGDMSLFAQARTARDAEVRRESVQGIFRLLRETDAVSIAVVHGHCVGSSLVLAGCCDFRICESDTKLLLPEINMSMLPGIGIANAKQSLSDRLVTKLLLTGDSCDAAVAEHEGFASEVVPSGHGLPRGRELAIHLLEKPTQALRDARRTLSRWRHRELQEAVDFELAANQRLQETGEPKKLAREFLQRTGRSSPSD